MVASAVAENEVFLSRTLARCTASSVRTGASMSASHSLYEVLCRPSPNRVRFRPDNDHTVIEVEVLAAHPEKLARTEARENQRRKDPVLLSLCDREERFFSSSVSGSTAGLRSRSFSASGSSKLVSTSAPGQKIE